MFDLRDWILVLHFFLFGKWLDLEKEEKIFCEEKHYSFLFFKNCIGVIACFACIWMIEIFLVLCVSGYFLSEKIDLWICIFLKEYIGLIGLVWFYLKWNVLSNNWGFMWNWEASWPLSVLFYCEKDIFCVFFAFHIHEKEFNLSLVYNCQEIFNLQIVR
jgi:hypothetical protein